MVVNAQKALQQSLDISYTLVCITARIIAVFIKKKIYNKRDPSGRLKGLSNIFITIPDIPSFILIDKVGFNRFKLIISIIFPV